MSFFEETLELHKERFEEWRAVVVLDDKLLRRFVACWGPQLVRRNDDYPLDNDLMALWACVTVDTQALADLMGEPLAQCAACLRQAQGLQVVYPDGTVAKAVAELLYRKVREIKGLG